MAEAGSSRRARAALQSGGYRPRFLSEPSLESLFIAILVLLPFRLGTSPIGDNSMLTHLRTGIDMVAGAGIPRVDPYSWTARGDPWVVQSWLPEWTYGLVHSIGGYRLVVLQQALLVGLLAWLVVRLARAGSPLRTALAGLVVVGIGVQFWQPRPLLFGLICFALLITVVERRLSPWLLVPVVWLWVQSHGSFPLGLLWLASLAFGEWLDWRARPHASLRYVGAFLVGLVVAVVNPLGARLLTFPFTVGEKRSVFENIVEWKSPDFQSYAGEFALVFLALGLLVLLRARLPWRDVIPVVTFLGLGLVAARNLPVLAVVLAPVLGHILRRTDPAPPASAAESGARASAAESGARRVRINRMFAGAIVAGYLICVVAVFRERPLDLESYPVAAATYVNANGLQRPPHRLANQDFVGNYLTFRFGPEAWDFIDDRYDMFPVAVSEAYLDLVAGGEKAQQVIDRYQVDVVIWQTSKALPALLAATGRWRVGFEDKTWVVLERRE